MVGEEPNSNQATPRPYAPTLVLIRMHYQTAYSPKQKKPDFSVRLSECGR